MSLEDGVRRRVQSSKDTDSSKAKVTQRTSNGTNTRKIFLYAIIGLILVVGIFLLYAYAVSPISAVSISGIHDISQFKWAHVQNKDLQRGKRILTELIGPESIAVDDEGNFYTGVADGRIVKIINPGKANQAVIDLTKSFDYAKGSARPKKRPLGLRLSGSKIYFADAYQGIIMIDLKSGNYDRIVGYNDVDPPLLFPDDITITADGKTVYFTDMSLKWDYDNIALFALEGDCTGRVFKADTETKNVELIMDHMCYTNGIELDRSEKHVIVTEHNRRRLAVIELASKQVVRLIMLPGGPDNVRRRKNGGYWVSIPYLPEPGHFVTWHPILRNILATVLGEKGILSWVNLSQGIAVKLKEDLTPESIHYDMNGKLSRAITEITELDNGQLAIGSFIGSGMALVDPLPLD